MLVVVCGCAAEPEVFGSGPDVEGVYAFDVAVDAASDGVFDGTSLELTFETSNDVFNNGVVNCGSVFELSGRWLAPWYDEEHLLDVLSATRMVYFTPLDFVMFH